MDISPSEETPKSNPEPIELPEPIEPTESIEPVEIEAGDAPPVTAPDGPTTLAPDALLFDRYRLKSQIGEGGIGQVWLADDTHNNDRAVAVKLPKDEYRHQSSFLAEAELMVKLEHPNIIRIFEMGQHDELGEYYVMEYFADGSLIDYLSLPDCPVAQVVPHRPEQRYVRLDAAIKILQPIAQALDYVHQNHPGTLHRDLKLSNILVDRANNRYVLTDFSMHIGAPSIMSPEQLLSWRGPKTQRQPLDWRSDLFAFGACLYKLTTGSYPFQASAFDDTSQAIEEIYRYQLIDRVPVQQPRERNPANPDLKIDEINNLIWQLTSKSRSGRTLNGQVTKTEDALLLLQQTAKAKKSRLTPIFGLVVLFLGLMLVGAGLVFNSINAANNATPTSSLNNGQANAANPAGGSNSQQALSNYPTQTSTTTPPPSPTTEEPTAESTEEPTPEPTEEPTTEPTEEPTAEPEEPTAEPLPPLQCDAGLALVSPQVNQQLSGQVTFQGTINQDNLDYYKIEFLAPNSRQWSCCLVDPTYSQINPENLGQWDTTAAQFPAGSYNVRLVAVLLDGNFNLCETRVTVENPPSAEAPPAENENTDTTEPIE